MWTMDSSDIISGTEIGYVIDKPVSRKEYACLYGCFKILPRCFERSI